MPSLHRIGKEKVINHHHEVPFRVLEKQYAYGDEGAENMIIHGDNLEGLKSLLPQYEGKIKCIYIDPPYNTGNEGRVYNDNMNHPKIKKRLGQTVGKEGEDFNRHDKWLCMMYPRLKLLHKLLRDDGVIFISIDDNEQANLKLMMDEIFGGSNFISNIIRQHTIQAKNDVKTVSLHHNYTFVYAKQNFRINKLERTEDHNVAYSNPDHDKNGPWRSGDFRSPNLRTNLKYSITTPSGKVILSPDKGRRRDKESFFEKVKSGEIIFNKDETKIIRKIYLNNQEGRVAESIWFGGDVGTTRDANKTLKEIFNNDVPFDTPKPTKLIEQIIKISTNPGDIILDSFAGSGTTAHAVLNLNKQDGGNRKFILLELMDYAETITAERVKRVINGYGEGTKKTEGTSGGFSYFTVGNKLFDDEQNLNETIDLETIKQYIRYTETKSTYIPQQHQYFLGTHKKTDYYFYYEPTKATILDITFLNSLPPTTEYRMIYADVCHLSQAFLTKHKILFKKIPRDITKF